MVKVAITRAFDHKVHGRIGVAELAAEVRGATLNGVALPEKSVEYLLTFALQSLQDAYAGADSAEDAQSAFADKLKRVQEGTIGVRAGGGVSAMQAAIRQVLRPLVKQVTNGWKDMEESARIEAIDAFYAGLAEDKKPIVNGKAEELIRAKAAEAAERAELAKGLGL